MVDVLQLRGESTDGVKVTSSCLPAAVYKEEPHKGASSTMTVFSEIEKCFWSLCGLLLGYGPYAAVTFSYVRVQTSL